MISYDRFVENLKRRKGRRTQSVRASRHYTTHGHVTESTEKQRRRYFLRKAQRQNEEQTKDAMKKLSIKNKTSPTRSVGGESIDSELEDIESIVSKIVTGGEKKKKKKKKKIIPVRNRKPFVSTRKRNAQPFSKPAWRPGGSLSTHSKGCHKSVEQVLLRQGNVSKFGSIDHDKLALIASQAFGDDPTVMGDPSSPLAKLVEEGISVSDRSNNMLLLEDASPSRTSAQDLSISLLEDDNEFTSSSSPPSNNNNYKNMNAREIEETVIRLRRNTLESNRSREQVEREIREVKRQLEDVRAETLELEERAKQVMSQFNNTFGEGACDGILDEMVNRVAGSIPDASPPSSQVSKPTTKPSPSYLYSRYNTSHPSSQQQQQQQENVVISKQSWIDERYDDNFDPEERHMDSVIEGVIDVEGFL